MGLTGTVGRSNLFHAFVSGMHAPREPKRASDSPREPSRTQESTREPMGDPEGRDNISAQ
eukprot:2625706-Karenia_brevis.AAC.1